MNEIQVFKFKNSSIRTVAIGGEPWFVGKDVAEVLGYSNTRDALDRHVDVEDRRVSGITTPGGLQNMAVINESGLYSLILSSKLPTAKEFKRWVTSEVLPSIRKNGGYIAGQEQLSETELLARALAVSNRILADREKRLADLTVQAAIMQPKADYFDELVDRNLLTNFRETAKQLGIGPKTFVEYLLKKKYIYRDQRGKLLPYEEKNNGLFEVKESYNNKTQWSGTQTMVTPKGRETFRLLRIE